MEDTLSFVEKIEGRNSYLSKQGNLNNGVALFDGPDPYVNTYNLYVACFNSIPNRITMRNSDVHKLSKRIEKEFANKIIDKHYMRYSLPAKMEKRYAQVIFVMKEEIMLDLDIMGEVGILFTESGKSEALNYEKQFRQRLSKSKESRIHLVKQGHFGLDLRPLTIKKPQMNLELNYNDDFPPVHKLILNNTRKKNKSGLILLHGCPGSGKSTYISYLINSLKKKIVFLPPTLAGELDSPQLTSLLVDNPNSIFIVEDAEQLIKSRELTGESRISLLLNLTDGILGEALNSIFICTFNTDLKNIDEALLRKGRLIASYRFDPLSKDKVVKLKDYFGLEDMIINDDTVLSDIYHHMENRFDKKREKKAIGFTKVTAF